MGYVIAFVVQVLALSVLTMAADFLLPAGRVKSTASLAARLIYVAAICDEIMGIFARWRV